MWCAKAKDTLKHYIVFRPHWHNGTIPSMTVVTALFWNLDVSQLQLGGVTLVLTGSKPDLPRCLCPSTVRTEIIGAFDVCFHSQVVGGVGAVDLISMHIEE